MRVVKEIANPNCKITIFAWNQKFLLKFELGMCEQTFKVSQLDVPTAEALEAMITPAFLKNVVARFESMHQDLA